jgi:N4-(beta-N-acetylglucosaminyl)-L-asparaginase
MEATPHVMLVGAGAAEFARQQGFAPVNLLTDDQEQAYREWEARQQAAGEPEPAAVGHDTIAMVGIDAAQNVAGGCSTSGMGYKLPGRVGDSPILGSGLYVDNQVGGAGATGVGENVMRFCGSFMIVEAMRHGLDPLDACVQAIRRIGELDGRPLTELHVNFVAVNRSGRAAAAGTDKGFEYAVTTADGNEVRAAELITV